MRYVAFYLGILSVVIANECSLQMWRPSGHPHFWFMGGSLALCRTYSRFVALQIKAIEEGINKVQ